MCQLVVHTFLFLLMTCFGNLNVTNKESNTDVNVKSEPSSIKFINSPKHFPRKVTSPTFHATIETQTVKSTVFNPRKPTLHKVSKKAVHDPTTRTRTHNSPSFETHTLNYATLNPYIPERTPNPALKKQTIDGQIYDANLDKWFKDTNVDYSLPNDDFVDTRRSLIDGLHDFKQLIAKYDDESKKLSEKNADEDIISNDKYELDALRAHEPVPPNFDDSFADTATRRLHEIQSEYLKLKADEKAFKSARRQYSSEYEDDIPKNIKKPNPIDRILALMDQFVTQSQQKLINGQILKLKYKIYVKYKIGYTFSLLRILKQQQLRLYSSMHFYRFYTPTEKGTWYNTRSMDTDYYLNLYEKITRLDDDIITLINYMWDLEKKRRVEAAIEATKFPKRKKYTPTIVEMFPTKRKKYIQKKNIL